jgi:hypothetical protein
MKEKNIMTNKPAPKYPEFPVNYTPNQRITNADDDYSSPGDESDTDDSEADYDDSAARARNPNYDLIAGVRSKIGAKSRQEIY